MSSLGKVVIVLGLAVVALGVVLTFADRIPFLGKLPGDVLIRRKSFTFYLPLTTCILLSLLVSFILWLLSRR